MKSREPLDKSTSLKYMKRWIVFVEPPVFTEAALKHLPDDEFGEVQTLLSVIPPRETSLRDAKGSVN